MFFIFEIQKSGENNCAHLVKTAETYNEAKGKYHEVLMYAAQSTLPLHSACIINEVGEVIVRESYTHETENPTETE